MAAPALTAQERDLINPYRLAQAPAEAGTLEQELRFALTALSLCRLALRLGNTAEARVLLTLARRQAVGAPPPVRRLVRRALPGLTGAIAVAEALADFHPHPPAESAGPIAGDRA